MDRITIEVPEHIVDVNPERAATLYQDMSRPAASADVHADVATPVQTTPTPETGKSLSGEEALVFGSGAAAVGLLFAVVAVRVRRSHRR